jgi:hypothetical protein
MERKGRGFEVGRRRGSKILDGSKHAGAISGRATQDAHGPHKSCAQPHSPCSIKSPAFEFFAALPTNSNKNSAFWIRQSEVCNASRSCLSDDKQTSRCPLSPRLNTISCTEFLLVTSMPGDPMPGDGGLRASPCFSFVFACSRSLETRFSDTTICLPLCYFRAQ